jgi:hypothetical protein
VDVVIGDEAKAKDREKTWSPFLFLFPLFNARNTYTKSQTTQHGFLYDGYKGNEIVHEKNILFWAH